MKIAIMQPYFFPYLGYFQLIKSVGKFVFYDDVNFIKGGWVNRNKILFNGKKHLLTMPVKKASPNKKINEIIIHENQQKTIKTVRQAYCKAPYFDTIFPLIVSVFQSKETNLSKFLIKSIIAIASYLDCNTEFIISSHLKKSNNLRGQDKVLEICQILMADQYINAIGGKKLYSAAAFKKNKIDLNFIQTDPHQYQQVNDVFIPDLSIIDVLMFNSKSQCKALLNKYTLSNEPIKR